MLHLLRLLRGDFVVGEGGRWKDESAKEREMGARSARDKVRDALLDLLGSGSGREERVEGQARVGWKGSAWKEGRREKARLGEEEGERKDQRRLKKSSLLLSPYAESRNLLSEQRKETSVSQAAHSDADDVAPGAEEGRTCSSQSWPSMSP